LLGQLRRPSHERLDERVLSEVGRAIPVAGKEERTAKRPRVPIPREALVLLAVRHPSRTI
jgi:hypothetical protein